MGKTLIALGLLFILGACAVVVSVESGSLEVVLKLSQQRAVAEADFRFIVKVESATELWSKTVPVGYLNQPVFVKFKNLPPGRYTVEVEARVLDSSGEWRFLSFVRVPNVLVEPGKVTVVEVTINPYQVQK